MAGGLAIKFMERSWIYDPAILEHIIDHCEKIHLAFLGASGLYAQHAVVSA